MSEVQGRGGRRTFGPVVLLGLATAGLAALAGNRTWVEAEPGGATDTGYTAASAMDTTADMPLAGALALVLLAAWGVLLVTRGRVRRAMAVVAALAAMGVVAAAVVGGLTLSATLEEEYAEVAGSGALETSYTPWFLVALIASVVAVVPAVLAVRLVPSWPEMGSRYDAPGAATPGEQRTGEDDGRVDEQRNLDLWRAIEEGRDPTA